MNPHLREPMPEAPLSLLTFAPMIDCETSRLVLEKIGEQRPFCL
jgi:hypothetical protein